jgi:glutamate/aspartate transport system substrate-binding protein
MKYSICHGLAIMLLGTRLAAGADGGLSGTLKKINDSGVITIGYTESIPFSYRDDHNQVIGYSQDMLMEVVEAIVVRLNRPDLTVKPIPLTGQNRVKLIQDGTIDIAIGPVINSEEDRQQVCYSNILFVIRTRFLTNKNSQIHDFSDLQGKNVVVTEGNGAQRWIQEANKTRNMELSILSSRDDDESFVKLQSGVAVAYLGDEVQLAYQRAKAPNPDDWVMVGQGLSKEVWSMVLPKGDSEFKELVDLTIALSETFGKARKLYKKWFLSPLPGQVLNLNLPMSDDMAKLFDNPNDAVFDPGGSRVRLDL